MPDGTEPDARRALDPMAMAARVELESAARRFVGAHETHVYVTLGPPGPAIVHIAADQGAEMIVMGTHARTGIDRLREGSVTAYTVRHAGVPVLILRIAGDGEERPAR
jgi:nucleotide-binding universal stress UspA family protein